MASKKKAFEIDKIRAALKFHGCKIKSIKECKPEPPDAIALIMFPEGNTWQRVGIEETEYYSGTEPGQKSSEQALHDFWDLTCTSIARRVGHRPNLSNIYGHRIKLNKAALLDAAIKMKGSSKWEEINNLASNIAEELVDLALEFSGTSSSKETYIVCKRKICSQKSKLPSTYPLLSQYVHKITLEKVDFIQAKWQANVNSAYVGISPDNLSKIIKMKAAKLRKCHFQNIDEHWLLITAPATSIFNSMHSQPNRVKCNDSDLINQFESAGFDRIFFWSRKPPEWCRQIWSSA